MQGAVISKKFVEKVARRALEWSSQERSLPLPPAVQEAPRQGTVPLIVEEAPFVLEDVPLFYHHLLALYPKLVKEPLLLWPLLIASHQWGGAEGVAFSKRLLSHLPPASRHLHERGYATYRKAQAIPPREEELMKLQGLPHPPPP